MKSESELDENALEEMYEEISSSDGKVAESLIEQADIKELTPQMSVNLPSSSERESFVTDDMLSTLFDELLNQGRQDRVEISDLINNFSEMVINNGDATSSSKEALVNLVKAKSDVTDKMVKVADLMTRIKLRERDTYRPYLTAKQETTYNFDSNERKKVISKINSKLKKIKQEKGENQ